jgi:uncharacterized RDD family membrane protein YckC
MSLSEGGSMTVVSVAPGGSAGPGRRLLASLVDWVVCLLAPFFLAGTVWFEVVPLTVVAYFAFFLFLGRTPGMRVASIRMLDRQTGRAPGAGKALARSFAALLQAASVVVLFIFAFSDTPNPGYPAADFAALAASLLVALGALLGHLWLLLDRDRRTLLDRLFGLSVVTSRLTV